VALLRSFPLRSTLDNAELILRSTLVDAELILRSTLDNAELILRSTLANAELILRSTFLHSRGSGQRGSTILTSLGSAATAVFTEALKPAGKRGTP
jgi:hypothetical protein